MNSIRTAFEETFVLFRANYTSRWGSQVSVDHIRTNDNVILLNAWVAELEKMSATAKEIKFATHKVLTLCKYATFPPSLQDFKELINLNRLVTSNPEPKTLGKLIVATDHVNNQMSARYGSRWSVREHYISFLRIWAVEMQMYEITADDVLATLNNIAAHAKHIANPPTLHEFIELCLATKKCDHVPEPTEAVSQISAFTDHGSINDLHPLIQATLREIGYTEISNHESLRKTFYWQYSQNYKSFIRGEITIEEDDNSHNTCELTSETRDSHDSKVLTTSELSKLFSKI